MRGWHHEQHDEVLILFNTVVMPLPCLFAKESGEICQWILKASFFVFGAWIRGWGSLSCFWIGLSEIKYARVWGYMCLQMKDILAQSKTKTSLTRDMVVKLLSRAHQCVRVHVALVNLTKSHDKVWKFLLKVTTKTRFELPAPLFLVPEIYRFYSPTNWLFNMARICPSLVFPWFCPQ